ncbi:MAG: sugar isomerase [Flammeovirgaceae bacterium]|nr:sugar isomerase [Flammeovirgaceae bacterium]MBE62587.1 sugar isomerase [Flammeovirgaceae bacterium]MBR07341.1 sugar isomerase [Rickettsiales bacterium]HCX24333.1 sugar isomerase [Cytophagales bacterium]
MVIDKQQIHDTNSSIADDHQASFEVLQNRLEKEGVNTEEVVEKLKEFQVAIPSWALGAGGTRFGRFSMGGEPGTLEEKIDDVGVIHALTHTAGAISLHIPWDIPSDYKAIKEKASAAGLVFDAVNSNTFQDQKGQMNSYKYGSLSNESQFSREQAIAHNIDVVKIGEQLGSKALTVWLADGASFPGQNNFRKAFQRTQESLSEIYTHMPNDWNMLVEYKPYEPNFYSTVIQDWGTSLMLAEGCGDRAHTLVDLGHHLPNTNIEQIVATLMMRGRLGGFHFNDSKYGDDDLTCGSIKPYQLFLIFNELVYGMNNNEANNPPLAWMIDASHNLKDPLEDLIQSLEAIQLAYAQALLVDHQLLAEAQANHDVTLAQEILQNAYRTDVRPLIAESRKLAGAAIDPVKAYRALGVRESLIEDRGVNVLATGL